MKNKEKLALIMDADYKSIMLSYIKGLSRCK